MFAANLKKHFKKSCFLIEVGMTSGRTDRTHVLKCFIVKIDQGYNIAYDFKTA